MAFSTSSFVALEGLSMTSPAAIWLIRVSESCLMAMIAIFADSRRLRKQKTETAEICTCFAGCMASDHFRQCSLSVNPPLIALVYGGAA
jgi:hypothetical protein